MKLFFCSVFLFFVFSLSAFAGTYRVDTTTSNTFQGDYVECTCTSSTCIADWDAGDHSSATCASVSPDSNTSASSTVVLSTNDTNITYQDSTSGSSTIRTAFVSGFILGSHTISSTGSFTYNTDYGCSNSASISGRCYTWYEGIWNTSGTITAQCIDCNQQEPPPPPPPPPPPNCPNNQCQECTNIICQCIDALKTSIETLKQKIDELINKLNQQPSQNPPEQVPNPAFTPPDSSSDFDDPPDFQLPTFERKDIWQHALSRFSKKFPFAIFNDLPTGVPTCPSAEFFDYTFEACWVMDAFTWIEYPVLFWIIIQMFISL